MERKSEERVLPAEAEAFVKELRTFRVKDIGSDKWTIQRERLERLRLQAFHNVVQNADEFVKDFIISYSKLPLLIHELLVVEVWKEKVYPLMLQVSKAPTSSFLTYIVLYFETVLAGLLEISLYYREVCEGEDGECLVELVDYCHRALTLLLSGEEQEEEEEEGEGDSDSEEDSEDTRKEIVKELRGHSSSFRFSLAMSCVSVLKYITDHLSVLPLSITTRLLNTYDIPCLLVHLIELAPWTKRDEKGDLHRYDDKWVPVPASERVKLSKVEGQVWLTLYQLVLNESCQQKYAFSEFNKATLLKLRAYLIEPVLEQIPALVDLQRYLQHLAIIEPPPAKRDLILEQVPVIREHLLQTNSGKWPAIAASHVALMLEPDAERVQRQAKGWVSTFADEFMEPAGCALCGKEATKRCSRCRTEWYCCRECQVKDWKKHKPICTELAKSYTT